jgi:arginine decarboxylase-like protein
MLQTLQHERQLRLPILLRFPQVVCHRMSALHATFDAAVARFEYGGTYRGVFPVKCNHDRALLEAMVAHGRSLGGGLGLEAGSKPELLLAASLLRAAGSDGLLVCNGCVRPHCVHLNPHCPPFSPTRTSATHPH